MTPVAPVFALLAAWLEATVEHLQALLAQR
jgi:hypothetical protein